MKAGYDYNVATAGTDIRGSWQTLVEARVALKSQSTTREKSSLATMEQSSYSHRGFQPYEHQHDYLGCVNGPHSSSWAREVDPLQFRLTAKRRTL
jgi:hypothetical protein